MFKVLVVDDEKELRESVSFTLKNMGHEVDIAIDGEDAIEKVKQGSYHMVILDVLMPKKNGLEALKEIKEFDPSIIVLVMTAQANLKDAVETIKNGAYNYIEKPIKDEDIQNLVSKAKEAFEMARDVSFSNLKLKLEDGRELLAKSMQMKSVFQIIDRLGSVNTAVLIRGESGTGKELVARAIHYNSIRKNKRFVGINCGAISENLIESELFGHEKGAFTGADQRKIGKFQYAEGGTLFLDEIGDITPAMQVKLLRVLQEKTFIPVGSNREIKCDVRIIAATNKPLEKMVQDGSFRQDLFYRLNVMPIQLPALRDRVEDIPELVNHFIGKFSRSHNRQLKGINDDALNYLRSFSWPGNIRELENVIERAFIMETTNYITSASLPENVKIIDNAKVGDETGDEDLPIVGAGHGVVSGTGNVGNYNAIDFQNQKDMFEKEFIINALKRFDGRINQTAIHANIPKNTLLRKIKKYGINAQEYSKGKHYGDDE